MSDVCTIPDEWLNTNNSNSFFFLKTKKLYFEEYTDSCHTKQSR